MDKPLKRARLAVLAAFFINGAILSTWVSRIPAIQNRLALSEGALGLVLFGMSTGVLVALSLAGGLVARFGSKAVTLGAGLAMCLLVIPLGLAHNPVLLWIALFIFGASISIMDVAMNDQAVQVERLATRPLMSSFHATYSIGGLAGALVGAGLASIGLFSPFRHFLLAGVILGVGLWFFSRFLLPAAPGEAESGPVFRLPERALWLLGAIAFCSSIAEGAMADWSGVYLNRVLVTTTAYAALGYASFSLTMTTGRLLGDNLIARWSKETVIRLGGGIAAIGLVLVILARTPLLALIGFALIGLGLANIIPVAFSVAGNFPGISSGAGIAGVATIGYAGFLAGPPVIGLIAEQTSLRLALVLVAVLVASLVFTGKAVNRGNGRSAE